MKSHNEFLPVTNYSRVENATDHVCDPDIDESNRCLECLFVSIDNTFATYMENAMIMGDQIEVLEEMFARLVMNTVSER